MVCGCELAPAGLPGRGSQARLTERVGWTEAMVAEAIADAQALRAMALDSVNTAVHSPDAVTDQILGWLSGGQFVGVCPTKF